MNPIFIDQSIRTIASSVFKDSSHSQIALLADEHTKRLCYPLLKPLLPRHTLITIKSGEERKNLETCSYIWQQLTDKNFDRKALLVNLGGGVIGDMGGFCASTYKRGIDFMQIPTTLLSQVDASVGGKLGIDFNGFKNHIGVFQEPVAVLIATEFLSTLTKSEVRSGFAEIIKHCLIADATMWDKIRKRDLDKQNWTELVPHSVEIKKKVVAQDPTEKGLRKILNFGHTVGHAVESYFLVQAKKRLLHGEAIAIGMICESYISHRRDLLDEKSLNAIEEFLFSVYGRVKIMSQDIEAIIPLTKQDKKNTGGTIQCVLLNGIGKPVYDQKLSVPDIYEALQYYTD
jgi:3-dehydroquinate synthase